MIILGSSEGVQGEYMRAQLEWNNPNVDSFHYYVYAELGAWFIDDQPNQHNERHYHNILSFPSFGVAGHI